MCTQGRHILHDSVNKVNKNGLINGKICVFTLTLVALLTMHHFIRLQNSRVFFLKISKEIGKAQRIKSLTGV